MNPIASNRLALILAVTLSMAASARALDWKKEKSADGKGWVEYRVSLSRDSAGGESPLIEYEASLIDSARFEKCLSVMLDVSNHKIINDDKASETIRKVSETEWILYYDLKIPWPLPKTDCVMRMKYSRDSANKTAEFHLVAAPDQVPSHGKKRLCHHRISYSLKDLGNGKIELRAAMESSPPFKLPLWMIRAEFPAAASDPLRNIVKLAKRRGPLPGAFENRPDKVYFASLPDRMTLPNERSQCP